MTSEHRDQAWLEELFDRYGGRLRAFAIRRVGPDNADDIVSEVFAITWQRRREVQDAALPWLYQLARHAVLHHLRASSRRSALADTIAAGSRDRPAASAEDQSQALVDSILDGLNETDAEVLRLTVWDQLTPSEIAQVLDLSPAAARNRLMRARRHAQELYESHASDRARAPTTPSSIEPCPTLT